MLIQRELATHLFGLSGSKQYWVLGFKSSASRTCKPVLILIKLLNINELELPKQGDECVGRLAGPMTWPLYSHGSLVLVDVSVNCLTVMLRVTRLNPVLKAVCLGTCSGGH